MYKVATCECSVCHRRVPKTEATLKTKHSYTGFSIGSQGNGRAYFRNGKYWICNECSSKSSGCLNFFVGLLFAVFFPPLIVFYLFFNGRGWFLKTISIVWMLIWMSFIGISQFGDKSVDQNISSDFVKSDKLVDKK